MDIVKANIYIWLNANCASVQHWNLIHLEHETLYPYLYLLPLHFPTVFPAIFSQMFKTMWGCMKSRDCDQCPSSLKGCCSPSKAGMGLELLGLQVWAKHEAGGALETLVRGNELQEVGLTITAEPQDTEILREMAVGGTSSYCRQGALSVSFSGSGEKIISPKTALWVKSQRGDLCNAAFHGAGQQVCVYSPLPCSQSPGHSPALGQPLLTDAALPGVTLIFFSLLIVYISTGAFSPMLK